MHVLNILASQVCCCHFHAAGNQHTIIPRTSPTKAWATLARVTGCPIQLLNTAGLTQRHITMMDDPHY